MTAAPSVQGSLFQPPSPPPNVPLGKGLVLSSEGELHVVFYGSIPLYHCRADDSVGCYWVMVDLVRHHGLKVSHVASAFGVHRATLHEMLVRFDEQGFEGLVPQERRRGPSKIKEAVERQLLELKRQGATNREAARRLGVTEAGVRAALRRLKWASDDLAVQGSLPVDGGACEPDLVETQEETPSVNSHPDDGDEITADGAHDENLTPPVEEHQPASVPECSTSELMAPHLSGSVDINPLNRQGDRLMAHLGLLDDAVPLFAPGIVPRAGVLLAVPLLIASGIFDIAPKVFRSIGPAFYGLRTSVHTFLLMALLRIKRSENLKEVSPYDLGRILGLDRAPEMRTLRGKLHALAAKEKSLEFMRLLAQARIKVYGKDLAYLYIDGHVRVYSGHEKISKAYVMQRRLAMSGTTDYWVNDKKGQPVLVITAEANEGMTKMLPLVLKEVRAVIGDRRATIVFDRGGWSPKLFKSLIDDKWDILTYRKGKTQQVARSAFQEHSAMIGRRKVSYQLAEKRVRFLGGKLKLRQITMLGDDGYQTNILTNKEGVLPAELAYYMFNRWRQENYFKYMKAEFAIDALVEYGTEDADPNRMVPNPKRKAIDKELKAARLAVAELERKLGAAALENKEDKRPTVRGFKIANGTAIGKPLREALEKVRAIQERRKSVPTRVTISEAQKEKPVRLLTEAKRLSDTFKMVAYQAETALVDLLRPHYLRTEADGRRIVASALQSAAELSLNNNELCVTLAAQSAPHRTSAIKGVCDELNSLGALFPGTRLRLRYEVAGESVARTHRGR